MAVWVTKNKGENNEHLIQRFRKWVRDARYVLDQRRHRRWEKPLTKRQVRAKAVKREEYRATRQKEALNA